MKKSLILFITVLMILTSCNIGIKQIDESEGNVNYYIYPYLKFTLSSDRTYYSASVVKGAKLTSVSVPGYLHTDFGAMPIKEFAGFEDKEDSVNLKEVILDVHIEKVKEDAFDKAENLNVVKTTGDKEGPKWAHLPTLKKDGYHFLGWKAGDTYVFHGMDIDPDNSEAEPVFEVHDYTYYPGKEPTCTEGGYAPYGICKVCGYSTYTELPALGHSLVYHDTVPATCTESGTRDYYECTCCHLYFSDENAENIITDIVIPAAGHKLTHIEGKDPTCQTEGVIEHWYCEICKNVYADSAGLELLPTTIIDKVDHKPVEEWSNNSEDHWKKCKWCSYEFFRAEHDFDDGVIIKSATIHTKGEKLFTCNTCEYEKHVDIPEHDHVAGETKVVPPTCFMEGYTLETCAHEECGELIKTNIVPALTHEGTEYGRLEPTCMTEGHIAHYHCDVCGYDFESQSSKVILESVKLNKVDHKAGSAYYHDEREHWNLCIYECGTKLNIMPHDFSEKIMTSEYKVSDRNCTQPDIYHYSCICSVAGTETFTDGEPLGHDITFHQEETNATCTEPGYHEYWYCDRCKLYFTDSALTTTDTLENLIKSATGHDWLYKHDDNEHWRECSKCHIEEHDSRGDHIWKYDVFNRQYCEICSFYPATGQGGFDVAIQDKAPLGHLDLERKGNHVKVVFIDDNSKFPPTRIIWYLNDTAIAESDTGKDIAGFYEIEFDLQLSILYRVRCEYSNDYGIRSESISLRK